MNAATVIPLSVPQKTAYGSSTRRASTNPVCVRFGSFELDEANARLSHDGTAITLAPRPFGLLCALARRPGSLLTKNELLDAVWGHQFVSESVLKTAISDLRTVLDDDPREPRFIETVSRRGYRFVAATTAIPAAWAALRSTAPIHGTDCWAQPTMGSRSQTPPCPHGTEHGNYGDKRAVGCPFVKPVDPSKAETGCALPQPVFATTAEVCYAHQLRMQLRARLLRDTAAAVEACGVGGA
jgi:DNA-binding winged helix-turn-helix (wHTH) protein